MSKCKRCQVTIASEINICPLCHNEIIVDNTHNIFPKIESNFKLYNLIIRILFFLSLLAIVFTLFLNYIISGFISWALFVILGIISFWLTFKVAISERKKIYKSLFIEVIVIIIASIMWDYSTGWYLWSITFVMPFICSIYTVLFIINRILEKNNIKRDYVMLSYFNSLIGMIPLYFLVNNIVNIKWPSIISVLISLFSLLFLMIFNRKSLKNELERRFHI